MWVSDHSSGAGVLECVILSANKLDLNTDRWLTPTLYVKKKTSGGHWVSHSHYSTSPDYVHINNMQKSTQQSDFSALMVTLVSLTQGHYGEHNERSRPGQPICCTRLLTCKDIYMHALLTPAPSQSHTGHKSKGQSSVFSRIEMTLSKQNKINKSPALHIHTNTHAHTRKDPGER